MNAAFGWVTFDANDRGKALKNLRGERALVVRAGPDLVQTLPPPQDQETVSSEVPVMRTSSNDASGLAGQNTDAYDVDNHALLETQQAHSSLQGLGEGMSVAIIESPIDVTHPDLAHVNFQDGYNFVYNIAQPVSPSEGPHYHGKNVAGIVAAAIAENDNDDEATGVSPDVNIVPITVLSNQGTGSTTNVARAILYAAGDCVTNSSGQNVCDPENPVDVINLSLGPVIPD